MKTEYNIKSIKQKFKENGVFYTPPEQAELIKKHALEQFKNQPKSVYDPTCGDGALLAVWGDEIAKFGQELDKVQAEVAHNRLKNAHIAVGDTLENPAFEKEKFEVICANPPFSIKWNGAEKPYLAEFPVLPPPSKADFAFIGLILSKLAKNGVAVVMEFPGVLYRGAREQKIRKWLCEKGYVRKIVAIPSNTFVDTKIPTVLIILKNEPRENGEIIFEDSANGKTATATLEQIKQNDFNLSPSNFIEEEIEPPEPVDVVELEKQARKEMWLKLRADLEFSKAVCELEGWNFEKYREWLVEMIKKF